MRNNHLNTLGSGSRSFTCSHTKSHTEYTRVGFSLALNIVLIRIKDHLSQSMECQGKGF